MANDWREQITEAAHALGVRLLWGEEIKPGDLYLACRNTGPKLFTCSSHNLDERFVVPREVGYCFDTGECVKVEEIK